MSDRRGSSRTLGITKQCAVFVRGGLRCAWCRRKLRAPRSDGGTDTVTASIDHYDGDPQNNAGSNLLPCCRSCNFQRLWEEVWPVWLARHGQTPERAEARAREQLAQPLDLDAGRALADRWHPRRRDQLREADQRYRARQRGELPPATDFP